MKSLWKEEKLPISSSNCSSGGKMVVLKWKVPSACPNPMIYLKRVGIIFFIKTKTTRSGYCANPSL